MSVDIGWGGRIPIRLITKSLIYMIKLTLLNGWFINCHRFCHIRMFEMADFLLVRNGWYHFKRHVPLDIRRDAGCDYWQKSLKTKSRATALIKARQLAVDTDRKIAMLTMSSEWDVGALGSVGKYARRRAQGKGLIFPSMEDRARRDPKAFIGVVFDKMIADGDLADSSIRDFRLAVKRFSEVLGVVEVERISREHIESYRTALRMLPNRPPEAVRVLTVQEQCDWADRNGAKRLGVVTINKMLTAIRGTLTYAFKQTSLISNRDWRNPVDGFVVKSKSKVEDHRLPFSKAQLSKIFGSPYRSFAKTDDRYWIPLVLMHTGARLDEICQCRVSDVVLGDVPYLSLENLDGTRNVKNLSSSRRVPIAEHLIDLGFLDWVATRTGEMLFDLDHDLGNNRGSKISKAFIRYVRALGGDLNTGRLVTHSLRHSFRIAAIGGCDNQDLVKVVMGHEVGDVSMGVYGREVSKDHALLKKLVIDKISFVNVDCK